MRTLRIFLIILLFSPISTFANEGPATNVTADPQITQELGTNGQVFSSAVSALTSPMSKPLQAQAADITKLVGACSSEKTQTDGMCTEGTSPGVVGFVNDYGPLVQMGSTMMTMNDACSTISDVLRKASLALAAYQTACALSQNKCKSSCGQLKSKLGTFQSNLTSIKGSLIAACTTESAANPVNWYCQDAAQIPQIEAALVKIQGSEGRTAAACSSYTKNTSNAIAGVMQAGMGMLQAKNCSDTHGTGVGESIAACIDPKNVQYNSPNCKCSRSELTAAECQRIQVSGVAPGSGTQIRTGDPAVSDGSGAGAGTDGLGTAEKSAFNGASSAPGLPGAPSGGGGGLGGGGGSGSAAQDGSGVSRKLNANVLGGFGGGGGGSGGGNAGPGYGVDKQLQEHGPGGAKDPKRTLASQMAKEITGQGGRSNWEKVRDRYKDNRRTLLLNK